MIRIYFVDLDLEGEVEQSFLELKVQVMECMSSITVAPKVKLVFYAQECHFVDVIARAKSFGIDISLISSAIYSPDLHEDLAQHLGMNYLIKGGRSPFWVTYRLNQAWTSNKM